MVVCALRNRGRSVKSLKSPLIVKGEFKATSKALSQEVGVKTLSLKTPQTLLSGYKEIQRELIWELPPCLPNAGRGYTGCWGEGHQRSHPAGSPVVYTINLSSKTV